MLIFVYVVSLLLEFLWAFCVFHARVCECRDSKFLVRRCAKPDRKEFTKHVMATGMGFVVMGFIGFFVKVLPVLDTATHCNLM